MKKFNLKSFIPNVVVNKAFTLAEVVIVMLVIAVIVSVCIKITKVKLNNILSVNYYVSYNTLKTISTELFRDFKQKISGISDGKCLANPDSGDEDYSYYCYTTAEVCNIANWNCDEYSGQYGIDCSEDLGVSYGRYTTKGYFLYPFDDGLYSLFSGIEENRDILNDYAGSIDYRNECDLGESKGFLIISEKSVKSLYNAKVFCEKFLENANTATSFVSEECNGDSIATSITDFSSKEPDFVLRNGMKFYNFSKGPFNLTDLAGNSRGKKYTKNDGTVIDLDEWGYIVYVDIDGERGRDSKLWKDVYRFYITLSGTVIPAYDSANPGEFGGDSITHLQTSVADQYTSASGRAFEWVTKSKSFKESACKMGLVKTTGANKYCDGVTPNDACINDDAHDCKLKTVMPVKFFN